MRLSVFSDYSLRVLIYLGLQQEGLATVGDIAGAYDISRHHLMKVVQRLAAEGHVETVRGKGGGLRLARAPGEIRLGGVLRVTEDEPAVDCLSKKTAECRIVGCCVLPGILREASAAFYDTMDRYTLADLLGHPRRLGALLRGK